MVMRRTNTYYHIISNVWVCTYVRWFGICFNSRSHMVVSLCCYTSSTSFHQQSSTYCIHPLLYIPIFVVSVCSTTKLEWDNIKVLLHFVMVDIKYNNMFIYAPDNSIYGMSHIICLYACIPLYVSISYIYHAYSFTLFQSKYTGCTT